MGRRKLRANAAIEKPATAASLTARSPARAAASSGRPAANVSVKTPAVPGPGKLWPVWCVLAVGVWIAFSPVLGNGFVDWDDKAQILDNHAFRGLGWDQIKFAFTNFTGGVCQPVGWLIQSLTYEVFPASTRGDITSGRLCFTSSTWSSCICCASRWWPGACPKCGPGRSSTRLDLRDSVQSSRSSPAR